MAREFAGNFYKTKAWVKCRKAFMESKHWTCERCGHRAQIAHHKKYLTPKNINDPSVTLSWDNLEALCCKCHTEEHGNGSGVPDGMAFDSMGNLIRR